MRKRFTALLTVLAVSHTSLAQESPPADRGMLSWAAFTCFSYARASDQPGEAERLFTIGYSAGKGLVNDIYEGRASEAEVQKMPLSFRFRLQGPSSDFVMGTVFEKATFEAQAKLIEGNPAIDPEIKSLKARSLYDAGNCSLLQTTTPTNTE